MIAIIFILRNGLPNIAPDALRSTLQRGLDFINKDSVQFSRLSLSARLKVPQEIAILGQHNGVRMHIFQSFHRVRWLILSCGRITYILTQIANDFRLAQFAIWFDTGVYGRLIPRFSEIGTDLDPLLG